MAPKIQTNVVLTPEAQKIKDRLTASFSATKLFSAGVILFNRLTAQEQRGLLEEIEGRKKGQNLAEINTVWESISQEDRQDFTQQFINHEKRMESLAVDLGETPPAQAPHEVFTNFIRIIENEKQGIRTLSEAEQAELNHLRDLLSTDENKESEIRRLLADLPADQRKAFVASLEFEDAADVADVAEENSQKPRRSKRTNNHQAG